MRFLIGVFAGGAAAFGCGLFAWPEPPPDCSEVTTREYARACRERDEERALRHAADRRAVLWETWAMIYRHRLHQLGTPQSWPGPTVSTPVRPPADPAEPRPELIPPPAVPFPTTPKEW